MKASRKLQFCGLITVFLVGISYSALEYGARTIDGMQKNGFAGTRLGFNNPVERAKKAGVSFEVAAEKSRRNPLLGWGEPECIHESHRSAELPLALLYGDSVSVGVGTPKGTSYVDILQQRLENRIVLRNHSVRGYGLDQMVIRALLEISCHQPELMIISYIPHDLLRMGTKYIYDWPKPKFAFSGGHVSLHFAERAENFYRKYADARKSYYFGVWLTKFVWENKEYFRPSFFTDYYQLLTAELNRLLEVASEKYGSKIVFIKLSNSTEFRGRRELSEIARSSISNLIDVDQCTRNRAKEINIDWERTFVFHPGETGHEIYADCILSELSALISGLRATTNSSSAFKL